MRQRVRFDNLNRDPGHRRQIHHVRIGLHEGFDEPAQQNVLLNNQSDNVFFQHKLVGYRIPNEVPNRSLINYGVFHFQAVFLTVFPRTWESLTRYFQ